MRRITYITGTRADYGLMRKTLQAIEAHPQLQLRIIATGMHLMPQYGETIKEIRKDGFEPAIVDAKHATGDASSMAVFFSEFTRGLIAALRKKKPDLILVLGDRAEMLAGTVAGVYMGIPVAHLHGGEVSGHFDDAVRHAITKLATIHLPATEQSAKRIESMGEDAGSIHVVGAPGLVGITEGLMKKEDLCKELGIPEEKGFLLIIEHPVDGSQERAGEQMQAVISAAQKTGLELVIIYPNADAGSDNIIATIKRHEHDEHVHIYRSLPHKTFISCMRYAAAMIGNSSGGIIEAASFKLPVVNVGDRQEGRQRSGNTIDVKYDEKSIAAGIEKALSKEFKEKLKGVVNAYGNGKTAERVAELLATAKLR